MRAKTLLVAVVGVLVFGAIAKAGGFHAFLWDAQTGRFSFLECYDYYF